jgi:hypothetical protein
MDYKNNKYDIKDKRKYLLLLFTFTLLLIGCSPTPTFIKPDFEQKQVKVIAIMPVVDKRNIVEDTVVAKQTLTRIEELVTQKLLEKNYDVISVKTVKNKLENKEIKNSSPEQISKTFNADGILISELYDYADKFYIDHTLKMHFIIYDENGDSLWTNDLDDSDKPFLSALGASIGWAIGVVVDNKITPKNKLPTILAGVAAAELIYTVVDAVTNETSESIDRVFKSLPDSKAELK